MPALQPFWDPNYTAEDPGPYHGELYATNAWDTARIRGQQVPGIVTVTAGARERFLWVYPHPANSAGSLVPAGYNPTRFSIQIRIWTPGQWKTLQPLLSALLPISRKYQAPSKTQPGPNDAFDVYHPALAALNISSAICVKEPVIQGVQEKTVTLDFLEYRKRAKAPLSTTNKSVAVVDQYDATKLANATVTAANGTTTPVNSTQGPQRPPSQSGVTLTPTP